MNSASSWKREILAVFRKEWHSEKRSLSGLTTTGLLCLVSVIIANSITLTSSINPQVAAGLYWMILVFSGSISLPRTFLLEEEHRTADLWRLMARPEAVYWGKALFNVAQMMIATILSTIGFVIMVKSDVVHPFVFILTAIGGALGIATTATLAGAIAAPSSSRYALATAISVPILVFLVNLGVTGTCYGYGEELPGAEKGGIVMIAYAIAASSFGPVVYSKIWKS